jgi:hypothetical protein
MCPDSAPTSASTTGSPTWSSTNRAQAPGNQIDKGLNDNARDTGHQLHEFLMRFAIAL